MLGGEWTTCSVSYNASDSRKYTFKVERSLGIVPGDYAIVRGNSVWPKIVKVEEIHPESQATPNAPFKYKWVVGRLDVKDIEAVENELDGKYPG